MVYLQAHVESATTPTPTPPKNFEFVQISQPTIAEVGWARAHLWLCRCCPFTCRFATIPRPLSHNHPSTHWQPYNTPKSPNSPFTFDDHHDNLICQYKAQPQPSPSPTASRSTSSTQPFCQDAECGPVRCGALRKHHRTLPDHCSVLRTIMVRCIAVNCGNVEGGLQNIVVLYGACGASSAPCSGVHYILSFPAIIAVHYENVRPTESLQTIGMLADHCSVLWCATVHCRNVAEAVQTN